MLTPSSVPLAPFTESFPQLVPASVVYGRLVYVTFGSALMAPWYAQKVPKPDVECPVGVATTISVFTDDPTPKWLAAAASLWICASVGLAGIGVLSDHVPARPAA